MEEKNKANKNIIRELEPKKKKLKIQHLMAKPLAMTVVVMLLLGIGTGYIASNFSGNSKKGPVSIDGSSESNEIKKGNTFGVDDTEQFPDSAEGVIREGGIDGEGAYHLERPGGESQNVYMTSAVVDLSQFIGKKVMVWGQTQTAQKAGWLMDVGKVEVL